MTQLGTYGGPFPGYGLFAPKSASTPGKSTEQITRIGLYGGPMELYGSFSGKSSSVSGGDWIVTFRRRRMCR